MSAPKNGWFSFFCLFLRLRNVHRNSTENLSDQKLFLTLFFRFGSTFFFFVLLSAHCVWLRLLAFSFSNNIPANISIEMVEEEIEQQQHSSSAFDFIVVGAGLAGCWTSHWLRKRFPNAKIGLLENSPQLSRTGCVCHQHPHESPSSSVGSSISPGHAVPHGQTSPSLINAGSMSPDYDGTSASRARIFSILKMKLTTREKFYSQDLFPEISAQFPRSFYNLFFLVSFAKCLAFPTKQIPGSKNSSWSEIFQKIQQDTIDKYSELIHEMKDAATQNKRAHLLPLLASVTKFGRVKSELIPISTQTSEQQNNRTTTTITTTSAIPFYAPWLSENYQSSFCSRDFNLNPALFLGLFRFHLSSLGVQILYDTQVEKIQVSPDGKEVLGLETTTRSDGEKEKKHHLFRSSKYVFCVGQKIHPQMNCWTLGGWGITRDYPLVNPSKDKLEFVTTSLTSYMYYCPLRPNGLRMTAGYILGQNPPSQKFIDKCVASMERKALQDLNPKVLRNISLLKEEKMPPDQSGMPPSTTVAARPMTPDGVPVVGQHPRFNNAFILNGLGHYGHSSAAFSRILVDQIAGDSPDLAQKKFGFDSTFLHPKRFWFGEIAFKISNFFSSKEK